MALRPALASLFLLASIPVCAAAAAAAACAADDLVGDAVPHSCGKRGLLVGLLAIWGTVLFGVLLGLADRLAERISPVAARTDTRRPGRRGCPTAG